MFQRSIQRRMCRCIHSCRAVMSRGVEFCSRAFIVGAGCFVRKLLACPAVLCWPLGSWHNTAGWGMRGLHMQCSSRFIHALCAAGMSSVHSGAFVSSFGVSLSQGPWQDGSRGGRQAVWALWLCHLAACGMLHVHIQPEKHSAGLKLPNSACCQLNLQQ